ncbi:hypothetical protein OSK08_20700, partial [Escherichia coli]|nr:hypothetical protein [Escherichia coli]
DRNRSHWSTSKTPSYTKSVSWQHHPQHVGQISPVLKWPMDKVYWVMPVSGLILVWYSVMNIIDNYRKRNSH